MSNPYSKLIFANENDHLNGDIKYHYQDIYGNSVHSHILNKQLFPTRRLDNGSINQFLVAPDITANIKIKDIPSGSKYVYAVRMSDCNYFNMHRKLGFETYHPRVITDAKNNLAKIVFLDPYESTSGTHNFKDDFKIIQEWMDKYNLPDNSVYSITGNLKAKELFQSKVRFKIIPLHEQEIWSNPNMFKSIPVLDFIPKDDKHLFLSFNRVPRTHRILFLIETMKNNLFEKGKISFNMMNSNSLQLSSNDKVYYDRLREQGKQIIDTDNNVNLANNLSYELHESTFVMINTETSVDNSALQFSEKVWKPIILGQPFMLIANNGALELLKEYGFMTFSDWFDESYDKSNSLIEKVQCVVNNLTRLSRYDISDLQRIRGEMREVCIHNKKVFFDRIQERFYSTELNKIINEKPVLDEMLKIIED